MSVSVDRQPLVRLEHAGKTFRMGEVEVEALRDATLQIAAGEIMVVVGPSGSGKTTLLNLVGGLDQPTTGKVWFQDRDLSGLSPSELTRYRRESVGFVFQFYNLIPTLTARENVMISTEISDRPLEIDATLEMVGLKDAVITSHRNFPAENSNAWRLPMLAKNPDLLLCDEPTGALDFETGKRVLELLSRAAVEWGKTVLIITHNLAISQMAHHVVRLRSGLIAELRTNSQPVSPQEINW